MWHFLSPGIWPNSRATYHEQSCLLAICRVERGKDRLSSVGWGGNCFRTEMWALSLENRDSYRIQRKSGEECNFFRDDTQCPSVLGGFPSSYSTFNHAKVHEDPHFTDGVTEAQKAVHNCSSCAQQDLHLPHLWPLKHSWNMGWRDVVPGLKDTCLRVCVFLLAYSPISLSRIHFRWC